MKSPYLYIASEQSDLQKLVLATLISTKGSTPQIPGSSAIFDSEKIVSGTIGGGVLEGRVTAIALDAIRSGLSGLYHFDLDKDIDHPDEAICGGTADVVVDAHPELHIPLFRKAEGLLLKSIPCVIVTVIYEISGDETIIIKRFLYTSGNPGELPELEGREITDIAERLLTDGIRDASRLVDAEPSEKSGKKLIFLEPLFPVPRLIIAGAGHIGKALCHLGSRLDFHVTVIDDRAEYANSDNLPEASSIVVGNIGEVLGEIEKDSNSFIVIVTRGHSNDSDALRACIGSKPAYIGMIGSRTKIAMMNRNFVENGWATKEQWSEIHAPIGLEIQSQTVEEIAISIAAQLVQERNRMKK